jgi:putative SOS response-associated peptidase YedK
MCYFFGLQINTEKQRLLEPFGIRLDEDAPVSACRSGFEYARWPVLHRNEETGKTELVSFHWEFIPGWITDEQALIAARKKGVPWLNARSETLLSSNLFGPSARKRRCLVPVTHFFEWRHYRPEGAARPIAYPYFIGMADNSIFYLAGIWQYWTDRSTGELLGTFAVVTTAANALMRQIHNTKLRQPTILTPDLAEAWLAETTDETRIAELAGFCIYPEKLAAWPIVKEFRQASHPTQPAAYPELPEIKADSR